MGDPVKNIKLDDLLAAEPVDAGTKPIKKVDYSVDDLLEAEPVVKIPDYDNKLQAKFVEQKAAEAGLIDNVKPFTPQLYEAKRDQITPFIQEVQGVNGKQPQVDMNAMEAKVALDKNVKRQREITANAAKLNLPPELLNQAVEFNESLIPVEEDKKVQESYLFGTLASFNDGLSTIFDTVDNAATLIAESAGFKWKNTLFKDISKSLKTVGKEGGYTTPETIVGDVSSAMASFAPDLMITFVAPEMKLAQLGKITGGLIKTIPKFPAWLGAKTGLQMWSQTKKPGDLAYGVAKGFTEGLTFEALGVLGNQAGLLAKSFGAGELVTTATAGIANGTLFGGHSVISDPEVFNGGKIDWDKAKENFWTNFGVGLAFHGKKIGKEVLNAQKLEMSATRKAYLSYWTANRDLIKTGIESPKTQRELRKESQRYWENALATDNPVERNQNLMAKTAIDNIILTRPIAEMVAKNPKKFKEVINSDKTLNDEQKKFYNAKIDNTVEDFKTYEETGEVEGKFDKDYFSGGRKASRKEIIKSLDKVDSEDELKSIKFPEEDIELKTIISERRKTIKEQKSETVKDEPVEKVTEKKTEISELQQPEKQQVPKSEQKTTTVKPKEEKKFTKLQELTKGVYLPNEISETKGVANKELKNLTIEVTDQRRKAHADMTPSGNKIILSSSSPVSMNKQLYHELGHIFEDRISNENKNALNEFISSYDKEIKQGDRYSLPPFAEKEWSAEQKRYGKAEQLSNLYAEYFTNPSYFTDKPALKKFFEKNGIKEESKFQEFSKSLGITKPEKLLEGAVRGDIGKTSVILTEGKNENEVVLETIKTPKQFRGKGEAGKALDKVLAEADKQNVTVKLTALPQEGSNMNQQQLINWYKDKGFEFEEGSNKGVRPPKEAVDKWFGNSKVVDEKGKPLKLYHGSPRSGIKEFTPNYAPGWGKGIYFTDNKQQAISEFGEGKTVYEVHLKMDNPVDGDHMGKYEKEVTKTKAWKEETNKRRKKSGDDELELDYFDELQENVDVVNKALQELGYDGIIASNSNNIKGKEYVVFNSDQVKLTDSKVAEETKVELPEATKENIAKAAKIAEKIETTDGASKKRKLEKEKEEILNADPKLKYLDENMGRIRDALEKLELLKMKGPCPV